MIVISELLNGLFFFQLENTEKALVPNSPVWDMSLACIYTLIYVCERKKEKTSFKFNTNTYIVRIKYFYIFNSKSTCSVTNV